jgi:hypothetical protein
MRQTLSLLAPCWEHAANADTFAACRDIRQIKMCFAPFQLTSSNRKPSELVFGFRPSTENASRFGLAHDSRKKRQ